MNGTHYLIIVYVMSCQNTLNSTVRGTCSGRYPTFCCPLAALDRWPLDAGTLTWPVPGVSYAMSFMVKI